jgi:hypothetical protein
VEGVADPLAVALYERYSLEREHRLAVDHGQLPGSEGTSSTSP